MSQEVCLISKRGCNMTGFPIGGMAYVRQPERSDEFMGLIVGKGDGMVRLEFPNGRRASFFYNELN